MPEVPCSICSQQVKFAQETIGKTIRCFSCGHRFLIEKTGAGVFQTTDPAPAVPASIQPQTSHTPAKITAVVTCVIAICVVAFTVAHFAPKRESVEEKTARYRKVCEDYDRVVAVKGRIELARARAKPKTFAEEQELYARLYREAGVDPHDVDRLRSEKYALARELGIWETH
jgi:DNA-directed RNA polymerase subunit RPC12/RpoP